MSIDQETYKPRTYVPYKPKKRVHSNEIVRSFKDVHATNRGFGRSYIDDLEDEVKADERVLEVASEDLVDLSVWDQEDLQLYSQDE